MIERVYVTTYDDKKPAASKKVVEKYPGKRYGGSGDQVHQSCPISLSRKLPKLLDTKAGGLCLYTQRGESQTAITSSPVPSFRQELRIQS